VQVFPAPAVGYVKILVHIASVSSLPRGGKREDRWTLPEPR
jgi:hypothetical protein